MKRSHMKRRPKRHQNISPEVIAAVDERAGGLCEDCHQGPDWRGFAYHEPIKGLGGTTVEFTKDQVRKLCYPCHSARHGIKEV